MQKTRPWLLLLIVSAVATAARLASAAGLGGGSTIAVMGQPLDFMVQVRLDTGEALTPECVSAEVSAGERRLPAAQVRTSVESQSGDIVRVRVVTVQAIDEPVLGIQLNAGCGARLSRRYVVLADPPLTAAAAATPTAPAAPAAIVATGAVAAPLATDAPAAPAWPVASADGGEAMPASPQRPGWQVAALESRVGDPPAPAPAPAIASVRPSRHRAGARAAVHAMPRAAAPARMRKVAAAAVGPRLKLDLAEPAARADPGAVELALAAVAEAASAARASALAASAASERIATLERTIDQMRGEAQGRRDVEAQLRERLAHTQDNGRWVWPLTAAVMLLAALAAWLAWRLSSRAHDPVEDWRHVEAAEAAAALSEPGAGKQATSPIPFVTSEIKLPPAAPARTRSAPAWPPAAPAETWAPPTVVPPPPEAPPESAMQRTVLLSPGGKAEESAPRDVSIDELIDLEQQAEFFVVLGQDDAAIDLLVEHLRHTGGGSPLPYLKLLEIYRRRGDRDAYERMRSRFNHRFNAYAPQWEVDLRSGRTLEDYEGVIPRLQQAWARPLDSMAELEALLFRKSRGELFDLPAYREVLFLYSLARDLLDREAADTGTVDLLLPLASAGSTGAFATPLPSDAALAAAGERYDFSDLPTSPVDLDLSQESDRPASIFDPLEDTQPFRRHH